MDKIKPLSTYLILLVLQLLKATCSTDHQQNPFRLIMLDPIHLDSLFLQMFVNKLMTI